MTTSIAVGGEPFASRFAKPRLKTAVAIRKASPQNVSAELGANRDENSKGDSSPEFLPTKVMKAIALAYESSAFGKLHITTRQVLAALIRFSLKADAPDKLAFVKKETLARHVGVSETTVYRSLTVLEGAGLIEREKQQRTAFKLEVIGRIRFTRKLLEALGITAPAHDPRAEPRGDGAHTSCASSGTAPQSEKSQTKSITYATPIASVQDVNLVNQQSSLKKQPLSGSAWKSINGKAVPAELAWLSETNGLSVPAIFLLMKAARLAGQRLSDVVAVTKHALGRLKGRELFAYVSALLKKEVDYSFVATQAASESAAKAQVEEQGRAARVRTAELATQLRGKTFSLEDGSEVTVDEASVLVRRNGYTLSSPIAMALSQLEALAAGAIGTVVLPQAQHRKVDQEARVANIAASKALLRAARYRS